MHAGWTPGCGGGGSEDSAGPVILREIRRRETEPCWCRGLNHGQKMQPSVFLGEQVASWGRIDLLWGRLIFGCQSTNQRACGDHLVIVFCSNAVSELAYMSQLGNSSAISRGLISWRLSDSNLTPRLKVEWGTTH